MRLCPESGHRSRPGSPPVWRREVPAVSGAGAVGPVLYRQAPRRARRCWNHWPKRCGPCFTGEGRLRMGAVMGAVMSGDVCRKRPRRVDKGQCTLRGLPGVGRSGSYVRCTSAANKGRGQAVFWRRLVGLDSGSPVAHPPAKLTRAQGDGRGGQMGGQQCVRCARWDTARGCVGAVHGTVQQACRY